MPILNELFSHFLLSTLLLQIRLDDPSKYQSIVDAEWNIIYEKLARCVESGANIVLSRLAIGDLATQYFADRNIFCAGRVSVAQCGWNLIYYQNVPPRFGDFWCVF